VHQWMLLGRGSELQHAGIAGLIKMHCCRGIPSVTCLALLIVYADSAVGFEPIRVALRVGRRVIKGLRELDMVLRVLKHAVPTREEEGGMTQPASHLVLCAQACSVLWTLLSGWLWR
jgi:hypothetical protein